MKFVKYVFALLEVSCMIPAVADCRNGSCSRRGHSKKTVVAAKKVVKKNCASCKGGYCKLR